jgi:hypothetical protein
LHAAIMAKTKQYGNPQMQVRVPRKLHRTLRGLAKLYKAPLPVFHRDLLVSMTDQKLAQEFQLRLARGMMEAQQRELMLTAKEGWSAPSKK